MKQPEPAETGIRLISNPDITPVLNLLHYHHAIFPELEAFLKERITGCIVPKRRLLLKEGMACNHIYYVVKGAIRGFIKEGSKDITTWITVEDELVTSILGLDKQTANLENIQALENCELLVLTYADLEEVYRLFPAVNEIARNLLQRYYADAEKRAFIARLTKAENKYRHFLMNHPKLANRIPLKYIASYLGMTLETLSRVRKKFSRS